MRSLIISSAIGTVLILLFPSISFSQGIKVKEMKVITSDLSASINQRADNNGNTCGLIKVLVNNPDICFDGNIVGNIDNKMNEYWVYLPKGSKNMLIKHPYYLPTKIQFGDYGIEAIEAKTSYRLVLSEIPINIEKNGVIIKIKPQDAKLKIDDYEIEGKQDGCYKLFLEKGEHVCKISAKGYRSAVEVIKKGKGFLSTEVNLESLMADVSINCMTSDADIYVNQKLIGKGSYKGMLPADSYLIECKKNGYKTISQKIELQEKESRHVEIPVLEKSICSFNILTKPANCFDRRVLIDGKLIGSDSIIICNTTEGIHNIRIEITGCEPIEKEITISDSTKEMIYNLTPQDSYYEKAYNKDVLACLYLVYYLRNKTNERTYWCNQIYSNLTELNGKNIIQNWSRTQILMQELLSFLNEQGKVNIAVDILNRFTKYGLNEAEFLARYYYELKSYELAIKWYKKNQEFASQAVPMLSDNFFNIARCYFDMGDYDNAIIMGKKAEDTYTGYVTSKELLGNSFYKKGNINMAIQWYKKALQCYRDGHYHGINNFIAYMKEIGLYDAVVVNFNN